MADENPLLCVPPADVDKLWDAVCSKVSEAYKAVDEFMPSDMLARLQRGDAILWVSAPNNEIALVVITTLVLKPSGMACKLMACSGDAMASLPRWLPQIERYARAQGCVKGYADGRAGWARVLPGYAVRVVTVEKLL